MRCIEQGWWECSTFRESCALRGYLTDDSIFDRTLEEARIEGATPRQMRSLFVIILINCVLTNPRELRRKYWDSMRMRIVRFVHDRREGLRGLYEDTKHMIRLLFARRNDNPDLLEHVFQCDLPAQDPVYERETVHLDFPSDDSTIESYGVTAEGGVFTVDWVLNTDNADLSVEMREFKEIVPSMNVGQMTFFNTFIGAIDSRRGECFFLGAPTGTRKTFIIKALGLIQTIKGEYCIATAASGVAAALIPQGKTLHSAFKLPLYLQPESTPTCRITGRSAEANTLLAARYFVFDEISMLSRGALEAIDRTLREITGNPLPFAGIPFCVLGISSRFFLLSQEELHMIHFILL